MAATRTGAWRVWRWQLHWQILLGLLLGAALGLWLGLDVVARIPAEVAPDQRGVVGGQLARGSALFAVFALIGDLFLRALFLIIVPLITSSIVLAAARLGADRDFGRLGLKTLAYFSLTTLAAILTGLTLVNLVVPGVAGGRPILAGRDLSAFQGAQAEVTKRVAGRGLADFLDVFRDMVPNNLVDAAAKPNFLGLIVVSLVTGVLVTRLAARHREVFERFVEAVYELSLMATDLILRAAPVGVLFLIAKTFAEQYATLRPDGRFTDFIGGIVSFAAVALAGMLIHFLITMPLVLFVFGRVNPLRHYRAMTPMLLTAFSTASSSATLPVTMECVEHRAKVSPRIAGFVLPLGATVNMNGTALYECVAAMFICQAFGVELSFFQQTLIVVLALLTSVGVAGVPSASLVAIAAILKAVEGQLPAELEVSLIAGMGLLFVFDRPLDMLRTALNVFGDTVGAVVIAKSEGETQVLAAGSPTAE